MLKKIHITSIVDVSSIKMHNKTNAQFSCFTYLSIIIGFSPFPIPYPYSSDPYAHSKRAMDLLSREINTRMNHKVRRCHMTCVCVTMSCDVM